jgi:DNA-binding CsgD family transcriptional regulator
VELVPGVFVAPEAELDVLERAAAGCRDGRGSALVVAGEAGVGKSRLLAEASEQARGAGMLVLRGRAASGAGQAPFRALAEALAGGLRERAVSETSLRSFAPALAHVLPGWFERTSDRAPELIFPAEGVLLLLRVLAGARGVLLAVEDLQSADPESLALVEYLAEDVGTERLLLVGTVRNDEPSAPLAASRELAGRGAARAGRVPAGADPVVSSRRLPARGRAAPGGRVAGGRTAAARGDRVLCRRRHPVSRRGRAGAAARCRAAGPAQRPGRATVPAQLAETGISSREMDVLLLLAQGLTNRQIAARLYLSPRAVEKHVERLLAKTTAQIASRSPPTQHRPRSR